MDVTAHGLADPKLAELLLRCLSTRPGTALLDQVAQSSTNDWDEVADVAVRDHLAPLLYKRIKESGARDCVPAAVWKRLRRAYFTNGDRNTRLYRELGAVLQSLRASGIPVIVLKGAYLAEAVYGDVALRTMCDNDLLVPQAELARAEAIVLDVAAAEQKRRNQATPAGGTPREEVGPGCEAVKHAVPAYIHDLAVELHWTIARPDGPVRVDSAGLWERARPASIAGLDVPALSPEDLLLHLCLHFCYQHGCVELRDMCDVAEAVHRFRSELDWAQVTERASRWGAARYAGLALHLAVSTLGARVPEDALERLVPGGLDTRLLAQATTCVLKREPCNSWPLLPFPNRFGGMSTWEKAKALREVAFPSRSKMTSRYPSSRNSRRLWPYYVLRLVLLPRTYGRAILQRGLRMMRTYKRASHPSLAKWLRSDKP